MVSFLLSHYQTLPNSVKCSFNIDHWKAVHASHVPKECFTQTSVKHEFQHLSLMKGHSVSWRHHYIELIMYLPSLNTVF